MAQGSMPGNEILVSSGVTRMFIGQPLVTSPSLYTTSWNQNYTFSSYVLGTIYFGQSINYAVT